MKHGYVRKIFVMGLLLATFGISTRAVAQSQDLEGAAAGAAASDPTAAVNFQDIRYRYFDLDGSKARHDINTEGSYVFSPNFKVTNELHYFVTDFSGDNESDFESLRIKGIYLSDPFKWGDVGGKIALGAEWIKDLGDINKGIGSGADILAPLVGAGWTLPNGDFVITLIQYFVSYETDSGAPDVSQTGPRLIYIHKIASIKGWLKGDLKGLIDHENGDEFSATGEIQLGTMVTPKTGVYLDVLFPLNSPDPYDWGAGLGMRFMY